MHRTVALSALLLSGVFLLGVGCAGPPENSIAEVRRLRPGSVETSEQEERLAELASPLVEAQDDAAGLESVPGR